MEQVLRFISTYPSEWKLWWDEKTQLRRLGPAMAIATYASVLHLIHGFGKDQLSTCVLLLILSYGGRTLEKLLWFIFPLLLTAIVYDSQRFYSDLIRGPVHVAQPYHFDKFFFGIQTPDGVLTPNEWFQKHTHVVLDVITGFAYLVFVPEYVLVSAFFYFLWRKSSSDPQAQKIYELAPRMMWAFFWLNVIGYTTYYWYAAAPPWYVAEYGLGPARMDTLASMAGCVRFDEALGTKIFTQWYGRSADVFGAIPSLHIAYPLLATYYSLQFRKLRVFNALFYLLMCFSAVYLNHHYVLDILAGSIYAIVIGIATDYVAQSGWGIGTWRPFRRPA